MVAHWLVQSFAHFHNTPQLFWMAPQCQCWMRFICAFNIEMQMMHNARYDVVSSVISLVLAWRPIQFHRILSLTNSVLIFHCEWVIKLVNCHSFECHIVWIKQTWKLTNKMQTLNVMRWPQSHRFGHILIFGNCISFRHFVLFIFFSVVRSLCAVCMCRLLFLNQQR